MSDDARELGAAAALAAIQQQELKARTYKDECEAVYHNACRAALENRPEDDGTDFDHLEAVAKRHLDDATERWQEICKLLLSYNKGVPVEQRDTSERISREQGEDLIAQIVLTFRTAVERLAVKIAGRVLECKNEQQVYALFSKKMREEFVGSVDSSTRENHLPAWVLKVTQSIL